ncbi:MAG: hypothetical protein M1832_004530 [Thelocarpon impressellum]|nr:MAG: hypothetical protein M1832_004530 [Thelocarpon impressellum]
MSYCMKVFVSSRLAGGGTTVFGSRVPIIERGMPAAARNSYNRVRQIIKLQWRPFGVVVIIVTNVIVSSVIFVLLDGASVLSPKKAERQMPWYVCLALSQGDQEKCRPLIKGLALDVSMAAAVLFVLALNGISCFAVLSYWTMFTGWTEITWKTLMRREDTWSPPVREGSGVTSRVEEKTPSFAMESPSPVAEDRAEIVTITRKPAPLTPLPVSRFSFGPATPSTQPAITSPKSPSWESTHSSAVTMTPASPVREFPPARETFNAPAPFPEPLRPRDTTYAPRDQAHGRQRPRSSSRGPPVPPKPEGYTPGRSPTSPEGGYSAQRFL